MQTLSLLPNKNSRHVIWLHNQILTIFCYLDFRPNSWIVNSLNLSLVLTMIHTTKKISKSVRVFPIFSVCSFQPVDFVAAGPRQGEGRWILWPLSFSFILLFLLLPLSPSILLVLSSPLYLMGVHLLQLFLIRSAISFLRVLLHSSEKVCRVPVMLAQVFTKPPPSLCLPLLAVLSMVFPWASFIFWLRQVRRSWLGDRVSLRFISTVLLGGSCGVDLGNWFWLIGKHIAAVEASRNVPELCI